jgi:hypothetical protein
VIGLTNRVHGAKSLKIRSLLRGSRNASLLWNQMCIITLFTKARNIMQPLLNDVVFTKLRLRKACSNVILTAAIL